MLLQSDRVVAPPGPTPDFNLLAARALENMVQNQWLKVPARRVTHGFSDPGKDEESDGFFAWDNEGPPYDVDVPAFEAQARPISNGEYATYLVQTGRDMPVTWTSKNVGTRTEGESGSELSFFFETTFIKTVYGPVPLSLATEWPVMASFNESLSYAKWAGYRIPTFDEVRSIYDSAEDLKGTSDGVTKPHRALDKPDPEERFVDLSHCNIGLQHFHPIPVTQNGNRLSGLGDMGGAWEWTSSLLEPFKSFKPMDIYPGYTGMPVPRVNLDATTYSSLS